MKQSIPIVNAERPLVDTGNFEELSDNVLNDKFRFPEGKVKEITEDKVIIQLPDGDETYVPRRTAIHSIHDVDVYTEPKVKVGQKVKEGDIITGAVGLEKDTYKSGLNALCLFHAMFGLVNEDALVISESFADRLKSYTIVDLSMDIKVNTSLKEILPIGSVVKSGDKVMTTYSVHRLNENNRVLNDKLGGIFGQGDEYSEYTTEQFLSIPNNIPYAVVSDVMVQRNLKPKIDKGRKLPDLDFALKSQKLIEEYDMNRKVIHDKYPEYVAADRLKPIDMSGTSYRIVYTVRIRLIMTSPAEIGSKITNRYGGKGVVSKVLPDNQMPIMVDKQGKKHQVECVLNPYSTINRKIACVNMEALLTSVIHRIHDLVEEWKGDPKKKEKIMPMIKKYYPGRYDDLTVDKFIKLHNSSKIEEVYYMNVGTFSTKFTPELINEWAAELGVEPQNKILMPQDTISDLSELKSQLSEDEYDKVVKDMKGKYVEVDKPLTCGWQQLMILHHKPVYSNKVTSSMFGVDVREFQDHPIMGRGEYRQTGQSIGEMELAAYLSRGANKFVSEARGDTSRIDNQIFLNNLLGLGLTITDKKGYNQGGSNLKDRLGELKTKYRLKKN